MLTLTANQTLPAPLRVAALTARASFTAAQTVPAPVQAAVLAPEYLPDLGLSAEQVEAPPRLAARLTLALWRAGLPSRGRRACRPCRGPTERELTR